ncbi:MAG: hypothetical protein AAF701_01735 [Pseudomonadota bacterium]
MHGVIVPTKRMRDIGRTGFKELAMFGLRKVFIDPAPRPKLSEHRMERFFTDASIAMDFWVPE